ncbi:hypothetical protein K491DRAFT_98138 [Lophiostoma macrostomum CBS 122681]|uniref:Uncharacterized protein n=1 Tax=Lophiostoma macrostomum CBS 122681 TaxID=1314788 RepID=A0A6A6SXT9_9PLEO|nr:hypothetical protein K491DRAFT_98138 [Lophiostoma macrostomum CBS 122681]
MGLRVSGFDLAFFRIYWPQTILPLRSGIELQTGQGLAFLLLLMIVMRATDLPMSSSWSPMHPGFEHTYLSPGFSFHLSSYTINPAIKSFLPFNASGLLPRPVLMSYD